MSQPIIRGIQAVGAVDILYRYNTTDFVLPAAAGMPDVPTDNGVAIAGFKLDQEFLRANPQIASSVVQPLLGGGGIALTNNNLTGQLVLNCSKVAIPNVEDVGQMIASTDNNLGVLGDVTVYDLVSIAQQQQAQAGGDSVGATLLISFEFCGYRCDLQFEACTIATVDPIGLAGNAVPDYQVVINYLNWGVGYGNNATGTIGTVRQDGSKVAA